MLVYVDYWNVYLYMISWPRSSSENWNLKTDEDHAIEKEDKEEGI